MAPGVENDRERELLDLLATLVREKEETRRLLSEFGRGAISAQDIVNELAAQYQTGIGGAVRGLAEYNKDAAHELGLRLRSRLDAFLAEIGESASPPRASKTQLSERLKDRDDLVLTRELVLLRALTSSDEALRSMSLFDVARRHEPGVSDEVVTAHLARLVKAGIVGKERKGRYHGTAETRKVLGEIRSEIEARGLSVPS